MNKKILFLTYDGICEPIGTSQILPYIKDLSKDYNITIISFEKINYKKEIKNTRINLEKLNIQWSYFFYRYKLFKILNLFKIIIINFLIFFKFFKNKYDIVHIRSQIPFFYIILPNFFF